MVGHQDVAVKLGRADRARVLEVSEKYLPELVPKEARLLVVAAQDQVLRQAGNVDSRRARHA